MNAMPQSAKALKLVGDVHANTSNGREKVKKKTYYSLMEVFFNSITSNILPRIYCFFF